MGLFELVVVWVIGVEVFSPDWPHRCGLFLAGVVLSFRVPMVFLPSDYFMVGFRLTDGTGITPV